MPILSSVKSKLMDPEEVLRQVKVQTGMQVGDLGCGNGYFTLAAARLVGGSGRVYAVDVLKSCLDTVRREAERNNLLNIVTVWSNLEIVGATKIPAESLDFVIIKNALYQSAQRKDFIKEALRLLKPQGKMLIIEWIKSPTPIGPPVVDRIGPEELERLISLFPQLKTVDSFDPGKYHYAYVLEKE